MDDIYDHHFLSFQLILCQGFVGVVWKAGFDNKSKKGVFSPNFFSAVNLQPICHFYETVQAKNKVPFYLFMCFKEEPIQEGG